MRILIVNIYFHPDPTGTGLVITELARDLAAQGHNVTVITSVPHYCRGGGGSCFRCGGWPGWPPGLWVPHPRQRGGAVGAPRLERREDGRDPGHPHGRLRTAE